MNSQKKRNGKLLSILFVLCMVLSISPITVFATEPNTGAIRVTGTYNGFAMEIYLNDQRVGSESANVNGTGNGYISGTEKNKITVQLAFGDGNIGSVKINETNMTIPEGTEGRAEFFVEPANSYTIVVTKSQNNANVPKTIIWDSDKTNNPDIKDDELLKNGSIEILDVLDQNNNSVGLGDVRQDLEKNNGWASIIPGSKVIFRMKPDYGYQLTKISINDVKLVAGKEQSIFEYTMPDTNVHISGIFEKVEDKVNAESDKVKAGTIELGGAEIDTGSVVLSVDDVTLSNKQITNFEETANGYEISSYLDINLDQVIYKGSATDVWSNELKELNNEATITLQLENGVNGNEVVIVHEKHDDTYEIIPTEYDAETNTVTFKTSSFSNYAIASRVASGQTTPVELIEINNATVSFKVGDKPVFTGTVPENDQYVFRCEWWSLDENTGIVSTEPEWGGDIYNNKITAFEAGKTYYYGVYVTAYTADISPNAKLKINGREVEYTRIGDESDTQSFWVETKLSMTPTAADASNYKIVEGANGTWTQNSDGTLTFRANGDFSKFTGVKVDGTLIDAKNYTAVSGSTVITLKADYLKTLSGGTHKITVVYTDGECSANFEIKKATAEPSKPEKSPQTGDNSNMLLWVAILFISGAGVAGITVYSKRKKYAE